MKHYKSKVILLEELGALYAPIPKTASSSVKQYLAEVLYPDKARIFSGKIHELKAFKRLLTEGINFDEFAHFFKFAFVRNPWDRIVSCYVDKILDRPSRESFMGKKDDLFLEYPWYRPDLTFKEFVFFVSQTPDAMSDEHFRSQSSFITDSKGKVFVDFFGKCENLQNDFAHVCGKLSVPLAPLGHVNKTKRDHYSSYYDEETRDLVALRYQDDIRRFGYSFEGAEGIGLAKNDK